MESSESSSLDFGAGDQPVRSPPKSLTLSMTPDERVDELVAQQEEQKHFLHKAKASISQMADEMARTQLMLAIEVASATLSATSRNFQRQAEALSADADRMIEELRAGRSDTAH